MSFQIEIRNGTDTMYEMWLAEKRWGQAERKEKIQGTFCFVVSIEMPDLGELKNPEAIDRHLRF